MSVRGTFAAMFVALCFSVAHADGNSSKLNNPKFDDALTQLAHLYQIYDCDHDFTADAAQNLLDACKEAQETPEIAAVRGAMTCSFDLENYVISAKTTVISPAYHVAPNGDVKKIVKGDLSVTAKQCRNISGTNNQVSGQHPATEDLCYTYFPDKSFAKYQEKAECSEDRKPASSVTPPSSPAPSSDEMDDDSDASDVAVDVEAERDLITYEAAVR